MLKTIIYKYCCELYENRNTNDVEDVTRLLDELIYHITNNNNTLVEAKERRSKRLAKKEPINYSELK